MSINGNNLYFPNWLGTPPLATVTDNEIKTTNTISTVTYSNTTVNVVPRVLLTSLSTAVLNTNNPSEIYSANLPETGWYKTEYTGAAAHSGAGDWSNFSQLDWFVKVDNTVQSNTAFICQPQYICGDSASQLISISGGGVFYGTAGQLVEWTTDGNATPAITSGYSSGFSFISIQKIA